MLSVTELRALSSMCLEVRHREVYWHDLPLDEAWEIVFPPVYRWKRKRCRRWLKNRGYDVERRESREGLRGRVEEAMSERAEFEPAMYTVWSLEGAGPPSELQDTLLWKAPGPVCVVNFVEDGAVLALTGGGMDLSWELCHAYVVLGFLPPAVLSSNLLQGAGEVEWQGWRYDVLRAAYLGVALLYERAEQRVQRFRQRMERTLDARRDAGYPIGRDEVLWEPWES